MLSAPALLNGTGNTQADAMNAMIKALADWNSRDTVEALCWDTTGSNLSPNISAATLLE